MAKLKASRLSLVCIVLAATNTAGATSYANEPRLNFPEVAIENCINGQVVAEFRVVNGHPVDMVIVSSEPDGLYTEAFMDYWSRASEWRKKIGQLWGEDTPDGQTTTRKFKFAPCDT